MNLTEREQFISLTDNDRLKKANAIILLEGDGFYRYPMAVELYKEGWAKKIVFSGGMDNPGYGSHTFEKVLPLMILEGIRAYNIIPELTSTNTREQAVESLEICRKEGWKRIILVASHYHQYRAYLTFLKALRESGLQIEIINAPARELPWFEETPWGKRIDLLEQEFERIASYSALGHIASYQEAIQYQQWKEQQPSKL